MHKNQYNTVDSKASAATTSRTSAASSTSDAIRPIRPYESGQLQPPTNTTDKDLNLLFASLGEIKISDRIPYSKGGRTIRSRLNLKSDQRSSTINTASASSTASASNTTSSSSSFSAAATTVDPSKVPLPDLSDDESNIEQHTDTSMHPYSGKQEATAAEHTKIASSQTKSTTQRQHTPHRQHNHFRPTLGRSRSAPTNTSDGEATINYKKAKVMKMGYRYKHTPARPK